MHYALLYSVQKGDKTIPPPPPPPFPQAMVGTIADLVLVKPAGLLFHQYIVITLVRNIV